MLTPVPETLGLASANAAMAFLVAESKLFRPVRERVEAASRFFGDLVSCGYCLGHWMAFLLVGVYHARLFEWWWPLDYLLMALVMAWLSAV